MKKSRLLMFISVWIVVLSMVIFFIVDESSKYIWDSGKIEDFSSSNKSLPKNIITIDSILTGATFTFIVFTNFTYKINRKDDKNTHTEDIKTLKYNSNIDALYWKTTLLVKGDISSFFVWQFFFLSFLSPVWIGIISLFATSIEVICMIEHLAVTSLVCEFVTILLTIGIIVRYYVYRFNYLAILLTYYEMNVKSCENNKIKKYWVTQLEEEIELHFESHSIYNGNYELLSDIDNLKIKKNNYNCFYIDSYKHNDGNYYKFIHLKVLLDGIRLKVPNVQPVKVNDITKVNEGVMNATKNLSNINIGDVHRKTEWEGVDNNGK